MTGYIASDTHMRPGTGNERALRNESQRGHPIFNALPVDETRRVSYRMTGPIELSRLRVDIVEGCSGVSRSWWTVATSGSQGMHRPRDPHSVAHHSRRARAAGGCYTKRTKIPWSPLDRLQQPPTTCVLSLRSVEAWSRPSFRL